MKKSLPLVISAIMSIAIVFVLQVFEYQNDPTDAPSYSDIPVIVLFFVLFTGTFFSFYQLRNFLTARIR